MFALARRWIDKGSLDIDKGDHVCGSFGIVGLSLFERLWKFESPLIRRGSIDMIKDFVIMVNDIQVFLLA